MAESNNTPNEFNVHVPDCITHFVLSSCNSSGRLNAQFDINACGESQKLFSVPLEAITRAVLYISTNLFEYIATFSLQYCDEAMLQILRFFFFSFLSYITFTNNRSHAHSQSRIAANLETDNIFIDTQIFFHRSFCFNKLNINSFPLASV